MKNLFLVAIILISQSSLALSRSEWMGTWVSKKLICPFGCSPLMRDLFEKSKQRKFQFTADSIIDGSAMSSDCLKPSKPDYSLLKDVEVGSYLMEHSDNEQANAKPKIKTRLPKLLGVRPRQKVTAGVIRCIGTDASASFSNQNIIFVDAKRAFARFEENAYWELSR